MSEREGLKFGILCSSLTFYRWQAEITELLIANGHQPSLIIMKAKEESSISGFQKFKQYPWKLLLYRLYQRYIFKPVMKQEVEMSQTLKNVPVQYCQIRKVDFSEFFADEDVSFILQQKLDFILRFGFNILRGKVLQAARYGIWSFHHGDEQRYRGGPPCFWEIYRNDPVTGAVLQKLNEKLDGGVILRKGWFGTIKHSYRENLERVYAGSVPWVLQVCNDIQNDIAGYLDAPGSSTQAQVSKAPGNLLMIWFAIKISTNRIRFHLKDILLHEKWNIGYIEAPMEKVAFRWDAYSKRIKWLPKPSSNTYVADPFVYNLGEVHRVVYEKYDYSGMRGDIGQLTLDLNESNETGVAALNDGSHFSFPFLFEHGVDIYCLPENAASGKLSLYRLSCNEKSFEHVTDLLPEPIIDPVLFKWGAYWWLFGTMLGYPSESLYIWYSTQMEGPFQAHINNPVKTDISSSRSAGKPFIVGNTLYRPAQNCSRTYGGSLVINQVLTLSPEEFIEQPATELFPLKKWQFSKGMHTLSGSGNITVIDAKRMQFIPIASWNKLKMKVGIRLTTKSGLESLEV
ncbi:MAG: hypothetical protein IH597_14690 [Bacteroidales bacterium]|nr:hypothetical protein [Bacteroidales bacterium]